MINHLLKQDCDLVLITKDAYGKVKESDPIPIKCRATENFKMVKNNAGIEVISSIQFWVNSEADIDFDTLTSRRIKYNDKTYIPVSVRNRYNTLGESMFKVVSV